MDAYIARQPIFDKQKSLFAYELLFRDGLSNFLPEIDGDTATSKLLSSSFFTIGIDRIIGGKRAFINFTENLILEEVPLLFPKENTVVEILEDVKPDKSIINACAKFSEEGYIIALDDFIFSPELKPLISLADIIKIDFRLTPIKEIKEYLKQLPIENLKLLAEKIETNEEFDTALDMGFEYFQGYFFCKPEIIKGREISSAGLNILDIMAKVNKPDFDFAEIREIMERDVSITYKLLRYINSPFFRRKNEITSLNQALVSLGENELRRFVSLIAMTDLASNKPEELIINSCIKAKFCEKLGKTSSNPIAGDELFTVGLLSNIDAILDQPMEAIMEKLPLSKNIVSALVKGEGELSDYLKLTKHYEKGQWNAVHETASKINVSEQDIPPIYLEACDWANMI